MVQNINIDRCSYCKPKLVCLFSQELLSFEHKCNSQKEQPVGGDSNLLNVFVVSIFQGKFYAWYFITGEKFGNIYVLSAVAQLGSSKNSYTKIVLNVWDNSINKDFYCCLEFDNYFSIVKATRRTRFELNTPNVASQYECDIPTERAFPGQVGVTELKSCDVADIRTKQKSYKLCSNIKKYYKIYYPKKNEGKLALCPKIAYDKIHPIKLIEWFEYQKLMGVTKVITSVQYLNTDALRVLEYYREQGIVEIVPYPSKIPGDVYGKTTCTNCNALNYVLYQF